MMLIIHEKLISDCISVCFVSVIYHICFEGRPDGQNHKRIVLAFQIC